MVLFRPMLGSNNPDQTPQFTTAEYGGSPSADRCRFCNQNIAGRYYRINDSMTCSSCAEQASREVPKDNHALYMRALLFGTGAALVGLALYATVEIMTGFVIGYLSLAVGYIIARAMMVGSNGLGGRRYQIAAVLLTYAAVSMAAVPVGISQIVKANKTQADQLKEEQQQPEKELGQPHEQLPERPAKPAMSFGAALGYLALMGLASPFLELQDPFHGVIGLIILSVGIQIAWRMTAGKHIKIDGPFDNPTPV